MNSVDKTIFKEFHIKLCFGEKIISVSVAVKTKKNNFIYLHMVMFSLPCFSITKTK